MIGKPVASSRMWLAEGEIQPPGISHMVVFSSWFFGGLLQGGGLTLSHLRYTNKELEVVHINATTEGYVEVLHVHE